MREGDGLVGFQKLPALLRAVCVARAQGEGGPGGRKEDHRTRPLLVSPANSLTCPNSCLELSRRG